MAHIDASMEEYLSGTAGSFELSDSDLEGVVGGEIGPAAQSLLLGAISKYKGDNVSLDQALAALPGLYDQLKDNPLFKGYLADTNLAEITEFVQQNW